MTLNLSGTAPTVLLMDMVVANVEMIVLDASEQIKIQDNFINLASYTLLAT